MRFWLTAIGIILLDRCSKLWIMNNMDIGNSWGLIKGILNITYVHNRGAAFGIMQGRSWLFVSLAAIVIIVAVYYQSKYHPERWIQYALAFIVGGAAGNVIDRILYSSVVDFISVGWFPVFNVADMAIVGGGILFMIYILLHEEGEAK